jgi:hypothetical protein
MYLFSSILLPLQTPNPQTDVIHTLFSGGKSCSHKKATFEIMTYFWEKNSLCDAA